MKKPRFLLIKGTVYPFDILVTTAPYEQVIKYIESKNYKLSKEEKERLEMYGVGRTVRLLGGQIVVRVRAEKTQLGFDLAKMVHELLHAVNLIFENISFRSEVNNDEPQAYFLDYLVAEVLRFYDKPVKQKIKSAKRS